MNYKRIYYEFCEYFKETLPKDRLRNRNPLDIRLTHSTLYTEKHHIIPRHEGGSDNECNLVEVLPEEHLFLHTVRYKAYNERKDFIAVRYMINGYSSKRHPDLFELSKHCNTLTKRVGLYRSLVYGFKKKHKWHTKCGRMKISQTHEGKMACVDIDTGESVGYVDVDHPNVVSGQWVHHMKGRISVTEKSSGARKVVTTSEYKANKNIYSINSRAQDGKNNGNYKIMTDDDKLVIFELVQRSIVENHFIKKKFVGLLKQRFSTRFKSISFKWIENNIGSPNELIEKVNKFYNVSYQYNPYFRSSEQKNKARIQESENIWVTNGLENKRIKKHEFQDYIKSNPEFYRGRVI